MVKLLRTVACLVVLAGLIAGIQLYQASASAADSAAWHHCRTEAITARTSTALCGFEPGTGMDIAMPIGVIASTALLALLFFGQAAILDRLDRLDREARP